MWQQERNLTCPGCRNPIDEVWVWHPDEQEAKQAAWKGQIRTCVACAERDFTHAQYTAANGVTHGRYPVVEHIQQ